MTTSPPLIAHVIHRLDVGGLENGVVNLINRLPEERFRHAIVCLSDYTDFRHRIRRPVELRALHRRSGKDPGLYLKLWRCFRELGPSLVHTRNLSALEAQLPAFLAGVRARVHGEHGWDVRDLDGSNRRYQRLRRAFRPLVQRWVPLSRHSETYLREGVGVPEHRIRRICNGVDTDCFRPRDTVRSPPPDPALSGDVLVIGAVGRLERVKDPLNLVQAFLRLRDARPEWRRRLRLVWVGEGSLRGEVEAALAAAGARDAAWLAGGRDDVAELLRAFDLFALPSLAEGISNTLLEAMASGLPVVATRVGGNPDLVEEGRTAALVPAADPRALADALAGYLEDPARRRAHGAAARTRTLAEFSLDGMVSRYADLYDECLSGRVPAPAGLR